MRLPWRSTFALACACAAAPLGCTLLESDAGLAGPPLAHDAGLDGTTSTDSGPLEDAGGDDSTTAPDDAGGDDVNIVPEDTNRPPADTSPPPPPPGPVAIYSGLLSPMGIAVHNGTICWVEGQSTLAIVCAPAAGGNPPQITTMASQTNNAFVDKAFDVALDDTYLYWSNGSNNQIVRMPLAGGAAAEYFNGDGQLSYISLEGTRLWASDYVAGASSGNVVVGPQTGVSSSQLIYPGETQAAGVGTYLGSVYWGTPDSISSGPEPGNATIVRVPTAGRVTGLALDTAGTAYFLSGNQQIYKLVQGGSTPQLLDDEMQSFGDSDLAVDDTAIYWTEHDLGQIMRMTKK